MAERTFKRTLLVEAYARSKSITVAMTALRFVVEYGRACDRAGEWPQSIEEFASHVGCSRAQAFRRQAAYRTCFPKQDVDSVWAIVKPLLDASSFKNAKPNAQAAFAASIVCTWTT